MAEQVPKTSKRIFKNQESKRATSTLKDQLSKKQHRKGENPVRVPPPTEQSADFKCSKSWICKNSACRAIISTDDTFCKRCSCCICHLFDDNKDPSLWLECSSESGQGDFCGSSCHIECAFRRGKVGVVDLGQLMQLDGSYCCATCGKVSGILGYWKKQLNIAKDARRVDVLCFRIFMSYRLLDGTSRFKELHDIVREAKAKLEEEVGPLNVVSTKMGRGIVSRLSTGGDVQSLCSLAIEKADDWLCTISSVNRNCKEGSLPAACRFLFEEVTSSSVVIILIELATTSSNDIKGYKLWYCKTREETHTREPVSIFPRCQRRILISNLQACTEYSFRIVSYMESGDVGHSEATCFTKSVEIMHRNPHTTNQRKDTSQTRGSSAVESDSGFKVRDLGKILQLAWAQEQGCFEGFCCANTERSCGFNKVSKLEAPKEELIIPSVTRELDLNVVSVPDLNEAVTPPADDAVSHGVARSNGSGDSQNWNNGPLGNEPSADSQPELCRKRAASTNEETHDCDSTLINGSPFRFRDGPECLDENFEYCVKIIRWLECEGYIKKEFRLRLLTWFSLRSTEQERRVVNTFIQTLIDDPSSLAGQLVDSFSDIISSKRPNNGFCSKLWH